MRPANAGGNVTTCFHFHSHIPNWHGCSTPIASAMPSGLRALDSPGGSGLAGPTRSGSRSRDAGHERPGFPVLVDRLIELYCQWRSECWEVRSAYEQFTAATREERALAYAAYQAALDREES